MNKSFINKIRMILNKEKVIPDLLDENLRSISQKGENVPTPRATPEDLILIGRLQTLLLETADNCSMPSFEEMEETAKTLGKTTQDAMADFLSVQEDGARRIELLESLIVEVVREIAPLEINQTGVCYFMNGRAEVFRRQIPQIRRLD